jgi:hypothetical protein
MDPRLVVVLDAGDPASFLDLGHLLAVAEYRRMRTTRRLGLLDARQAAIDLEGRYYRV